MSAEAIGKLNPERNLVIRAQNGDANAFAALYEMHKPRVQAVCLRMTNNVAEAEDMTQDAFIYVVRKLSTFRGDSAFSTWLHRIAVNTVLMHFRKTGKRHVSLEQPNPQDLDAPRREFGRVDDSLAACPDRLALARAIDELPRGYRTIFLLHEVQGYEHQEIARRLHCSTGNSKSQLHKAKLRLRELLAPRGYTCHKKNASMRAPAVHSSAPVKAATFSSPAPASAKEFLRPSNPSRPDGNERKGSAPGQPSDIAASVSAYEKQAKRRRNSTIDPIVNLDMMLPVTARPNSALMAESGS